MKKTLRERIRRIELRALSLLAIALPIAQTGFDDVKVTFGVALGGGIELANFHVLRRIVEKLLEGTNPNKAAILGVALVLKFSVVAACIYASILYVPVNPAALIIGVSIVILSIVIEGFIPEKR